MRHRRSLALRILGVIAAALALLCFVYPPFPQNPAPSPSSSQASSAAAAGPASSLSSSPSRLPPPPPAPASLSGTTLVSAYYNIRSKKPHSQYKAWMSNFLQIRSPLVVFVDPGSEALIRELRGPGLANLTRVVPLEMKDFRTAKYDWKAQLEVGRGKREPGPTGWPPAAAAAAAARALPRPFAPVPECRRAWPVPRLQLDREKAIHSPELYMVWVEKSDLVMRVRPPFSPAASPSPRRAGVCSRPPCPFRLIGPLAHLPFTPDRPYPRRAGHRRQPLPERFFLLGGYRLLPVARQHAALQVTPLPRPCALALALDQRRFPDRSLSLFYF